MARGHVGTQGMQGTWTQGHVGTQGTWARKARGHLGTQGTRARRGRRTRDLVDSFYSHHQGFRGIEAQSLVMSICSC